MTVLPSIDFRYNNFGISIIVFFFSYNKNQNENRFCLGNVIRNSMVHDPKKVKIPDLMFYVRYYTLVWVRVFSRRDV